MIRKLRRKFIFSSILAVIVVLLILMLGINVGNALRVDQKADEVLTLLAENEGTFPADDAMLPRRGGHRFSEEMPFETRFFSVLLDEDDRPLHVNVVSIAAVTADEAVDYAQDVRDGGKREGYAGIYKYRVVETDVGTLYLFLDRERELSTLRSFFFVSLSISLIGTVAISLLIWALSYRVTRPIAESYDRQTRFITDASHELKTPLTIISANAEVLELEHGESEWLTSIQNQVGRLATLTESLTALCRMEENRHAAPPVDFSLSDAVLEALEPFKAPAALKELTWQLAVQPALTWHGDERAVRQLVSLLADNAVKYTPHGGTVSVSLRSQGKRVVLGFRNTVEPIRPGNYDRLFERFYRADPARSSSQSGSGIGLSIAQAIVASMNGTITAYSEDGNTLCFVASF